MYIYIIYDVTGNMLGSIYLRNNVAKSSGSKDTSNAVRIAFFIQRIFNVLSCIENNLPNCLVMSEVSFPVFIRSP